MLGSTGSEMVRLLISREIIFADDHGTQRRGRAGRFFFIGWARIETPKARVKGMGRGCPPSRLWATS